MVEESLWRGPIRSWTLWVREAMRHGGADEKPHIWKTARCGAPSVIFSAGDQGHPPGDLAGLRKEDPEAFVGKVADGLLHEGLAHQLRFGNPFDNLIFNVADPSVQQHDQYFQTRQGTLMDSAGWRVGNKRDIRPLYSGDQKKIEERLKPINRKDE